MIPWLPQDHFVADMTGELCNLCYESGNVVPLLGSMCAFRLHTTLVSASPASERDLARRVERELEKRAVHECFSATLLRFTGVGGGQLEVPGAEGRRFYQERYEELRGREAGLNAGVATWIVSRWWPEAFRQLPDVMLVLAFPPLSDKDVEILRACSEDLAAELRKLGDLTRIICCLHVDPAGECWDPWALWDRVVPAIFLHFFLSFCLPSPGLESNSMECPLYLLQATSRNRGATPSPTPAPGAPPPRRSRPTS